MSRRLYSHNRVRYWYAYDIDDICMVFKASKLHPQTVRKWIKRGLKTIDKSRPALIYGNDLITFLKKKNLRAKCKTKPNELFCMKCQDARHAYQNKVVMTSKNRVLNVQAKCRECKKNMSKKYKLEDVSALRKIFITLDVLELDDCLHPPCKTHLAAYNKTPPNEPCQGILL